MWRALFGYDIFISYSSRNSAYAAALEARLKKHGFRVFRDQTGSETGDRLEKLLRAARRSRMMIVIVTNDAIASPWVRAEMDAFLEAPGVRRLAGIFFRSSLPQSLPEPFSALKTHRGIRSQIEDLDPPVIRDEIVAQIRRAFRAARTRVLQMSAAMSVLAVAVFLINLQTRSQMRSDRRGEWRRRAEVSIGQLRMDLAELALANAGAAAPSLSSDLLAHYAEARSARKLTPLLRITIPNSYRLIHAGGEAGDPFALYQDQEGGAVWLDRSNQRTQVVKQCKATAIAVSRSHEIVLACGTALYRFEAEAPGNLANAALQAKAVALHFAPLHLLTLEKADRGPAVVRGWDSATLEQAWSKQLSGSADAGESGLCDGTPDLAWTVNAERGRLVVRRWALTDAKAKTEEFSVPERAGALSVYAGFVSAVSPAPDCGRFFVEYAPNTIPGARPPESEYVRIRVDSAPGIALFDNAARSVTAVDETSGYEGVYLTRSGELRALVSTSPVVLEQRVQTFGTSTQRIAVLEAASRILEVIGAGDRWLTVYSNGKPVARYPSLVEGAVRTILVSPNRSIVAVAGENGISLWASASNSAVESLPDPATLSGELGLTWRSGREPEYTVPKR